jgi:hypothetical protein
MPSAAQVGRLRQFTAFGFTGVLREAGVRISIDERDRWIERLWRGLKCKWDLPARIRDRLGTALRAHAMEQLLQHPAASFDLGRANAKRDVWDRRHGRIGGLTKPEPSLTRPLNCPNETGPPRVSAASAGHPQNIPSTFINAARYAV